MIWSEQRPYVSATERRATAEKKLTQLQKQGKIIQPVSVQGRAIAARSTRSSRSSRDNSPTV